jgi:hypothetical protein
LIRYKEGWKKKGKHNRIDEFVPPETPPLLLEHSFSTESSDSEPADLSEIGIGESSTCREPQGRVFGQMIHGRQGVAGSRLFNV